MEAQNDEMFVYMGGDQVVPDGVRRVRIHRSVKIIPAGAFRRRQRLISVEFHDDIEIIEKFAFNWCLLLSGSIKLLGVKVIKAGAFYSCQNLTNVEFGDKLETIERGAFRYCNSIRTITMPSVRTIEEFAFYKCQLTDLKLPEELERVGEGAFGSCHSLERITMPLKDGMIEGEVFHCNHLTAVNLVGGIHKTVSSLPLKGWRTVMTREINRINRVLPLATTSGEKKTTETHQWMSAVIRRLNHYKVEHYKLLKEATTLLELALWKANLDDNERGALEKEGVRTRRQLKRARKEVIITSGASIVIKNVLPFLELK